MSGGDNGDSSRGNTEEFNAWLASLEAMDLEELIEYGKANKRTFSSEMKAAFNKVVQEKKKQKPRKKKKRTALHPILGAVLKFHKDDDDDDRRNPPGGGGGGGGAPPVAS